MSYKRNPRVIRRAGSKSGYLRHRRAWLDGYEDGRSGKKLQLIASGKPNSRTRGYVAGLRDRGMPPRFITSLDLEQDLVLFLILREIETIVKLLALDEAAMLKEGLIPDQIKAVKAAVLKLTAVDPLEAQGPTSI